METITLVGVDHKVMTALYNKISELIKDINGVEQCYISDNYEGEEWSAWTQVTDKEKIKEVTNGEGIYAIAYVDPDNEVLKNNNPIISEVICIGETSSNYNGEGGLHRRVKTALSDMKGLSTNHNGKFRRYVKDNIGFDNFDESKVFASCLKIPKEFLGNDLTKNLEAKYVTLFKKNLNRYPGCNTGKGYENRYKRYLGRMTRKN